MTIHRLIQGTDRVVTEYLDLHELQGLDEKFLYQILVFVADVKDEVVLFQSEEKMCKISFPERLRNGFLNAKCELALLNGIKVKGGEIELTKHTTMIRVLDRNTPYPYQNGFNISKSKSFPNGTYLNWPRNHDVEGQKMIHKVYPFVGRFFERCSLLYMKPIGEFKCNNPMDNFLHVRSIFNRWARWDQSTKELLSSNEEPSTVTIDVSEENGLKREYVSDEEPKASKMSKISSSEDEMTFQKSPEIEASKAVHLISSSDEEQKAETTQKEVNLILSSDEEPKADSPTTSDENFIDDRVVQRSAIRPNISFNENQRNEFLQSLAHFKRKVDAGKCAGKWTPFEFNFLTERDFVKIVCQSLTVVHQGQIKALEMFVASDSLVCPKEVEALLCQMENTPPNFNF